MSEFILDHGTRESAAAFKALDDFTQGYIEAMFFTSTGTDDDEELEDADLSHLAPETWTRIKDDCAAFQETNRVLVDAAIAYAEDNPSRARGYDYTETYAGHDYWYTRNGYGVGYWDRGLGEFGAQLSEACGRRECYLYRGDDGLLYLA